MIARTEIARNSLLQDMCIPVARLSSSERKFRRPNRIGTLLLCNFFQHADVRSDLLKMLYISTRDRYKHDQVIPRRPVAHHSYAANTMYICV